MAVSEIQHTAAESGPQQAQSGAFTSVHCFLRSTISCICSLAHFDEYQLITVSHDQINFTPTGPVVTANQFQSAGKQLLQG